MRALLQRVSQAQVDVAGQTIGSIDGGLLIFFCAMSGDSDADVAKLAAKVSKLRIFKDDEGRMNKSVMDSGANALVVSQFTLGADTSRGNRPGFAYSASPDEGQRLYNLFCEALVELGIRVETGEFGADMQVQLVNDGPVTIWLDTQS